MITVSATLDENLSPQMPPFFNVEVRWPHTVASGMTDAMIEAAQGVENDGEIFPRFVGDTVQRILKW